MLNKPIDRAILIYFRFMAGILMSQELINGLWIGKFKEYTIPKFHFSYFFFEWVQPWPYWGMALHYFITILAGLAVAFGIAYRLSAVILFLGFTSLFLMDMSEYINHTYLYCLLSFWMIFLPLKNGKRSTAPAWTLYLILFHMGLAYFFGGVAKLNSDWLAGTPMNIFLSTRKDSPLGFLYTYEWSAMLFSYGGIIFDLFIVPLMLISQTRKFGLVLSIFFHLSNVFMFGLATFPWFSLMMTTLFFDPSWPRKIPGFNHFLPTRQKEKEYSLSPLLLSSLLIYGLVHVTLPMRHWLYPGNTSWTEQGHLFAWRMMLRVKKGTVHFTVQDKTNKKIYHVRPSDYLTSRQIYDMTGKPEMIIQFAHFLRDEFQKTYNSPMAVFASSPVALNGRKRKNIIREGTDLALEKRTLLPYSWIVPLEENNELVSRE